MDHEQKKKSTNCEIARHWDEKRKNLSKDFIRCSTTWWWRRWRCFYSMFHFSFWFGDLPFPEWNIRCTGANIFLYIIHVCKIVHSKNFFNFFLCMRNILRKNTSASCICKLSASGITEAKQVDNFKVLIRCFFIESDLYFDAFFFLYKIPDSRLKFQPGTF